MNTDSSNPQLKYRFVALYKDGTIYEQNAQDVSVTNPQKSCFYDIDVPALRAFALYGPDGTEYLVDLQDGHFEINEIPFFLHNEPCSDFRLIYFRRNILNFGEIEPSHAVSFNFGWQTTFNGQNVKRIMTLT